MEDLFLSLLGLAAVLLISLPLVGVALLVPRPKRPKRFAFYVATLNGIVVGAIGLFFMLQAASYDEHGLAPLWLAASAAIPFTVSFVFTSQALTR